MSVSLTSEELDRLKQFQSAFSEIAARHGAIFYQKRLLDTELTALTELFDKMESDRSTFTGELTNKYGQGSVDITTGFFTSEDTK